MISNPVEWIGVLLVLAIFMWRFNMVPTAPAQTEAGTGFGAKLLKWFWMEKRGAADLFQPPRANTTLFKFRLYQLAYVLLGLLTYLAVLKIPGLGTEFQEIIKLADPAEQLAIPAHVGPVVLAFIIAVLLPMIPPFSVWDAAIRYMLYERAAIPAQQLRERNRLKKAPFRANAADLTNVKNNLAAEGFVLADIVYDAQNPSTCSLWAKAALLMEGMGHWEARNKYKTAFAILKERDGVTSSIAAVKDKFEALQGDAKACFEALREAPDEPESEARQEAFRQNCKALLDQIYDLLSRVSLHAHFSERERVREMNQLGFGLKLDWGGPVPGYNDLLWLAMILGLLLVLPLSGSVGLGKALTIGGKMFVTVLTPLVLVSQFPNLAQKADNGLPSITFPVLSAVIAMLLGMAISVGYRAFLTGGVLAGWNSYMENSSPWTWLLGLVAVLIAWRMQAGAYPDNTQLHGMARYRLWGSLGDAALFGAATAALMWWVVLPMLQASPETEGYWRRLLLPVLTAVAVGFIVPTWYRAQTRRKTSDRRKSGAAARAKFQEKIQANYGLDRRQSPAG